MAVKPELSALLGVVSWWVPIIAATAVVLIRGRGSIGARVLLKIASILICISPLFFPQFREDLGWEGFKARVKHDVQPHDLSQWLAGYIATNSSPLWARKRLGPAEMAVFCRGGMRSTPAWVEKSERSVMIAWGSDFQIWAVAYGKATDRATEWQDNLFFRQLSK